MTRTRPRPLPFVFSSWTGLPSTTPQSARGCSRNRGPCHTFTVSSPAIPGQITFRPPEYPAIRCGSISPVVIFNSARVYRLSIHIGTPLSVVPR